MHVCTILLGQKAMLPKGHSQWHVLEAAAVGAAWGNRIFGDMSAEAAGCRESDLLGGVG